LIDYPTPSNLNTSWNGGSLAGMLLVAQIVTGVCLAMHYTAHVDLAFSSVQHHDVLFKFCKMLEIYIYILYEQ
jgi:ubiquinol-cytochrome c reductase cytochrome b subunit